MTLIQMRYLLEVCRLGTLSKAASELYISQPALTSAIRDLERQLGISIFRRVGRKLILTADGEYLREKITPLLKNYDTIIADISYRSSTKNNIRLAIPMMTGSILTPLVLGEFHDKYPDIKIELEEVGGIKAIQMVEREEIELALANYEKPSNAALHYVHLFKSTVCFCVHKDNPLAKRKIINIEDIAAQPLVILRGGYLTTHLVDQSFERAKLKPNILLRTQQLYTVKNLVAKNMGTALLTKEIVADNPHIVAIPLAEPITFSCGIITKRGKQTYTDTKSLIDFLIEKFNSQNSIQ